MDINRLNNMNMYNNSIQNSNIKKTESLKAKVETSEDDKKLMQAAEGFEAEFMKILIKEMRSTVPDDGLIPKSPGMRMVEDMYYEKMAEDSPKGNGSIGLAKSLYDQLKRKTINDID